MQVFTGEDTIGGFYWCAYRSKVAGSLWQSFYIILQKLYIIHGFWAREEAGKRCRRVVVQQFFWKAVPRLTFPGRRCLRKSLRGFLAETRRQEGVGAGKQNNPWLSIARDRQRGFVKSGAVLFPGFVTPAFLQYQRQHVINFIGIGRLANKMHGTHPLQFF